MTSLSAESSRSAIASTAVSAPVDALGILLDLALEATAATGAALLIPDGDILKVLGTRGGNAPAGDEVFHLGGTVCGEAWYRGRLVVGAEPPPRGRQAGLWHDDRTIDVMAAPVLVAGRPVAVLQLFHRHLGHFRRHDATTLTRLASLAGGLWSESSALRSTTEARASLEVRAAARMALLGAAQLEEPDAVIEVARAACALLEVASARVSLLEGDELVCQGGHGRFAADLGRHRPRSYGFEGMALESPEGVLASDWSPEAAPGGASSWIRSLIAVPLRRLDQVIGVVTVADEQPGRFGEGDREALLRFAIHATVALGEARLIRRAERGDEERRLARSVALTLAGAEDTPTVRRLIVRELRTALAADGARLTETVQGHLAVTAVEGDLPELVVRPGAETWLFCQHRPEAGRSTHRCDPAGSDWHLLSARTGRGDGLVGSVQLARRGRPFTAADEELLRRLTDIAELWLLARLSNVRVSQYANRIRSVAEVSATLHQSLSPAEAMAQAAEMLQRALAVGTVRVGLVDEAWQELHFPVDRRGQDLHEGGRRPLGRGLLEEVWRTGRTYFLPRNAVEEAAALGLALDQPSRCIAAVALRTRGTVRGVVVIEDEARDHAFGMEDVRILEIVAQQLGVTLENLESLEEERRQRITAEWLRQMARTATDPDARPTQAFELAADAAYQGVGGLAAVVRFLPGDGRVAPVASRGHPPDLLLQPQPLTGSVAGWIFEEHGAVFISANLAEDPRLGPDAGAGALALAGVPIWSENRVIAVVEVVRPAGSSFAVAEVERLAQIADHAGAGYQTARAGEALRTSEERYRRLFSSATDAIFTLDHAGVIGSLNTAAERLWGVPAGRAVGQRWDQALGFDHPAPVADSVARAMRGESCELETTLRRPDGERGTVGMTISPLVEEGATTAVLAIARDVTDQRRVQAQLLQAEKMSAMGQLVGGMAHEINNPLASILVNMELLLGEVQDPAQLETLGAIKTEADRTAQIVRNLLTYVRGQGSERAIFDLREAVRGAYALRRNQLASQQIEVLLELPAEPVLISGNRVNLQQVMMNLLINAEHAIRADRGRGHVWVRLATSPGHATVTVEDDGPGIPPELVTRIFDPFYTTKPEGEGTGLGLSVSAGIVADHEGRIVAGDRPGGGARFVVEIPLSQALPGAQTGDSARSASAAPAPIPQGRILLVDDEPDIRRSISKFLTRSGWAVDLADSGEEGLRLLARQEYAAVLCDLRMPGISGHEFYRRLEAMQSPAVSRLVFMTGDVLSPEASRFLQAAGRPVLSKPFTLRDLSEVLRQVVPA